jgi:hypothetical protein
MFEVSVGRTYERLYTEQVGKRPGFQASSGPDQWSKWYDTGYGLNVVIQKEHGRIMVQDGRLEGKPPIHSAIECAALPPYK